MDKNSLNLLFLNISLHLNEACDPDSVTSIVKHHIPDAKLTAQSEEKLAYILPLEEGQTNFQSNRMRETSELFVIRLCTITVVFRMMADILLAKYIALWCL